MRVQRFQAGDVVRDIYGTSVLILEVHKDPHPAHFSHCSGVSSRYTVRTLDRQNDTRWDWQLLHLNPCNTFSAALASQKADTPAA